MVWVRLLGAAGGCDPERRRRLHWNCFIERVRTAAQLLLDQQLLNVAARPRVLLISVAIGGGRQLLLVLMALG